MNPVQNKINGPGKSSFAFPWILPTALFLSTLFAKFGLMAVTGYILPDIWSVFVDDFFQFYVILSVLELAVVCSLFFVLITSPQAWVALLIRRVDVLLVLSEVVILFVIGSQMYQDLLSVRDLWFASAVLGVALGASLIFYHIMLSSFMNSFPISLDAYPRGFVLLHLLLTLFLPMWYLARVYFLEDRSFQDQETLLLFAAVSVYACLRVLMAIEKQLKLRYFVKRLSRANNLLELVDMPVTDVTDLGVVQSNLRDLAHRHYQQSQEHHLLTQHLSTGLEHFLRKQLSFSHGLELHAVVVRILIGMSEELDASSYILFQNQVSRLVAYYAHEVNAYPFFYGTEVMIIFGILPYDRWYRESAVNTVQAIVTEISRILAAQSLQSVIRGGMVEGNVVLGVVHSRSEQVPELTCAGPIVEEVRLYLLLARKLGVHLAVDEDILLHTGNTTDKVYRMHMEDGTTKRVGVLQFDNAMLPSKT